MTPPVKPEKGDPLDFLGTMGEDPLSFLPEGGGEDPLGFLGNDTTTATPEPAMIAPVADHELSPELRLSDLANRPDISPVQKARIERLMHAQRRSMGGEEQQRQYIPGPIGGQQRMDELIQQAALTFTQGALHLPEMVASTVGRVLPAAKTGAEALGTFREGIEPEVHGDFPITEALVSAGGTASGEVGGGIPVFKAVSGVTGVAGAVARSAAPRLAARAEIQLGELSARVLARTGNQQLASAILAAPKELIAGTVFQGLLDPESLKTPAGAAMAFLFGTLGALGEGVRVARVVEAEKVTTAAREAAESAKKSAIAADEQAAKMQVKIAEVRAEELAKDAARRSWEEATPEMRRVMLPAKGDEVLARKWKKLPLETQQEIVSKIRVAASDSRLNTSKPAAVEPPAGGVPPGEPPAGAGTPVLSAERIGGGTTDVPLTPETTPQPSSSPTAEPLSAPAPTPEVTPAAAGAGETMSASEVVMKAQELVGRDGLAREVASVLSKRKSVPASPEGVKAIMEAVSRKIIDRQTAGGEKAAPKAKEAPVETAAQPVEETRPPEADTEITRLQAELEAERSSRLQSERRAHAAERASEIDNLTGLQNQNSWGLAQRRIDSDPNSHIILIDVKQFHAYNKRYGQAAGDEFLRQLGQSIREALTGPDQAFRIGGDEFAVVTTPEFASNLKGKLQATIKDAPIEGTEFTTGIRTADGKTFDAASQNLVGVAAGETGPKARPVDIATPDQQGAYEPKEPVEALGAKPKPKRTAKKAAPAAPPTRAQMDYAATKSMTEPQLQDALVDHLQAMRQVTEPTVREGLLNDMGLIRREIRMREKVTALSDEALDTHANEMKALWEQLPEHQRGPIEARLAEVDVEFKRRSKPDILDVPFGNERQTFPGGLLRDVDPLEAKTGTEGLSAHSKRIQDKIVVDVQGDRPFPGVKDLMRNLKKVYTHVVRGTFAADVATKQLGREGAPAVQNPGAWAELLSGSAGRAQRMMEQGPFTWLPDGNIQETGIKPYKSVLAPFKGRLNELRRFEIAKYAIELLHRAKEPGIELVDAIREVNSAADDIKAAADESVQVRQAALQYLTDAGMFGEQARSAVQELTRSFFPLNRWLEGVDVRPDQHVDPIRATVDMIRRFVRAADLNRLGVMLVEAAEARPELAHGLVWKETRVRTALDPSITQQAGALRAIARNHGINLSSEVATEVAIGLNGRRLRSKSNTLHVWREGKREIWAISPELAEMYQSFQPHEMHWLVRAMGFIPQMAKTGITDNPIFGFFNAWKDTFDAMAQSKYGFRWGVDSMTGFFNSLRNSNYRAEFRAGAGTAGGVAGRAVGSTEQSMRAILPTTPAERATTMMLHPIDALRELSVPFEEAARLGEFARARQAGAPVMDAAIASQRVTTNFRQRGLSMQAASHIVMFLNPAIQSLDTNIRAVGRNPGKVVASLFAAVTLPSMYLWAANHGNKRIEEVRKSRFGSAFWFFEGNDGRIFRIPKPFMFGAIFGTGAEDALDALYDKDPTAGDRFIQTLVDQIPYNVVPTVMNLTLGLIYNRDFGTGAPIAPDKLEQGTGEVEPRFQARPETGPTARALGDMLNVSPAKLEFAVRTATGTLGQDVLRGIDMVNNAKAIHPAPMAAEIPVVGRMLAKYPSAGAFNLRRFYDDAKKVEVAMNTIALLEKGTDPKKLESYMDHHRREIALSKAYAGFRKELATLRSQTDYIATLPASAMTPEQKRRLIDLTVHQMIVYSRDANEAILGSTKDIDFSPQLGKPADIQK